MVWKAEDRKREEEQARRRDSVRSRIIPRTYSRGKIFDVTVSGIGWLVSRTCKARHKEESFKQEGINYCVARENNHHHPHHHHFFCAQTDERATQTSYTLHRNHSKGETATIHIINITANNREVTPTQKTGSSWCGLCHTASTWVPSAGENTCWRVRTNTYSVQNRPRVKKQNTMVLLFCCIIMVLYTSVYN